MFQNPFSFYGRIRRLEYGLSLIIVQVFFLIYNVLVQLFITSDNYILFLLLLIPVYWFLLAQGIKRCHDRGNSGWYVLIPFYGLWLIFADGEYGENWYGPNPKGLGNVDAEDIIENLGQGDYQ